MKYILVWRIVTTLPGLQLVFVRELMHLLNNTCASCRYWLILIKSTLETTVPQYVASQEMGEECCERVVGFGFEDMCDARAVAVCP